MKEIRSLSFWQRSPNSVESVYSLTIVPNKKGYQLQINIDSEKKERLLSNNEVKALLSLLFDTYQIDQCPEEYKAFRYEDDKNNFTLKFFLEIDFKDYTYLCIKGIPHFSNHLNTFFICNTICWLISIWFA